MLAMKSRCTAWLVGAGRGTVSAGFSKLHFMPAGVVVSFSFTPLGMPAVMQNAVISPHAVAVRAALNASRMAVRFIGFEPTAQQVRREDHLPREHSCTTTNLAGCTAI